MLKSLKFRTRLIIGFSIILLSSILIGIIGIFGLNYLTIKQRNLSAYNNLSINLNKTSINVRDYIITDDIKYSNLVFEQLEKMKSDVMDLRDSKKEDKISKILSIIRDYGKNFKTYFDLELNKKLIETRLIRESGILLDNAEELNKLGIDTLYLFRLSISALLKVKEFIQYGKPTNIQKIKDEIAQIINLSGDIVKSSSTSKIKSKAFNIHNSAKKYRAIFNEFIDVEEEQEYAKKIMESSSKKTFGILGNFINTEKTSIHNSIENFRILSLIIPLFSLILGIIIISIIINYITQPLTELADATQQITRGNFDIHIDTKTKDEIGFLNETFNKMSDKLKESFSEIQKQNEKLEERVKERTETLSKYIENLKSTQNKLVKSEKMAMLGKLIASITHELNTPLSAIYSSSENISATIQNIIRNLPYFIGKLNYDNVDIFMYLIYKAYEEKSSMSSREERKQRKNLEALLEKSNVENSSVIADTLIDMNITNDIENIINFIKKKENIIVFNMAHNLINIVKNNKNALTASKKTSKTIKALKNYSHFDQTGKTVKSNIIEDIETSLTLHQNDIKKGVSIIKDYDSETPLIYCYPDELSQVWSNLISNSLYAMNYHGTLKISVKNVQNNKISIAFTDTGRGIPKELQKKIFEPFYTTKPKGEGSGLGLDICKNIIDKHNGEMTLKSKNNETTFTVTLPKNTSD